jgi:hypothetical protein
VIRQLVRRFERLDRCIEALAYVLLAFLLILAAQGGLFVYERQYSQLWSLLAPTITLLSALIVVLIAKRLIINGDINREDDRRQELVRTAHHLIAIAKDLRARVEYVKTTLSDGSRPALSLTQVAKTIEDRYETLLERDAYKFLPGKCVDIISNMSGAVFGIGLLAEGVKHVAASNPAFALKTLPNADDHVPIATLDKLMADLQELLDELFKLRTSMDSARPSA